MNQTLRLGTLCLVFILFSIVTIGCSRGHGEERVQVSGKLTQDGKPIPKPNPVTQIEMRLWPVDGGESQGAVVQPDGSFTVPGNTEDGIKPGKYKVEVRQWLELGKDGLRDKFSQDKTPIEREILQDTTELNIDISK